MRSLALILGLTVGFVSVHVADPVVAKADDIDKILKAKEIVKKMVNYPDTLQFHNLYTKVSGNTVTLKFTAKNAFGVPETRTMNIKVD